MRYCLLHFFKNRFNKGSDFRQPRLGHGFKTKHQGGLGIGGPDQTPTVIEKNPDPIDIYHIVRFAEVIGYLGDDFVGLTRAFLHAGADVYGLSLVPLVPAWITVVIISREFLVTGLRLLAVNKGVVISAGKWGKHKTVWQIVAIVLLLMRLSSFSCP